MFTLFVKVNDNKDDDNYKQEHHACVPWNVNDTHG